MYDIKPIKESGFYSSARYAYDRTHFFILKTISMAIQPALFNKEEILGFSLWQTYWHFIVSLQKFYLKLLKEKTDLPIHTRVESAHLFTDNEGSWENGQMTAESEEIYFTGQNRSTSIRLIVSYGVTQKVRLDLGESFEAADYYSYEESEGKGTDFVFSSDVILAAITWLDKGELTEFAKKNFHQKVVGGMVQH